MADADPILGVDVSHHNGAIDWRTVANAGFAFAYAKATEGVAFADRQFQSNWAGIRSAGMLRGAYHFFRPALPVARQADQFAARVGPLAAGDLPPMLDLEETSRNASEDEWPRVGKTRRVALALEWLERVEQALGRQPIIYTRGSFVEDVLGAPGLLLRYPMWIAHYTEDAQPQTPAGWPGWLLWQYSQTGRVDGLKCDLDLNRFQGSEADLRALAGVR
jgi:lysozyme